MARVRLLTDISNLKKLEEVTRYTSQSIEDIVRQVNGSLNLGDNLSSQTVVVGFPQVNTDVKVEHNLNRTGLVYLVGGKSGPCDIYDGVAAATKSQIYLRSDTAGVTVTIVLI